FRLRGNAGYSRRPTLGARKHRKFWWRPEPGDDFRPIGRWTKSSHADVHARREGALPKSNHRERRFVAADCAGGRDPSDRAAAAKAGSAAPPSTRATEYSSREAARR